MAKQTPALDSSNIAIIDEPAPWKWALSVLFTAVVAGALYGLDLFGTSYYYVSLHNHLQDALKEKISLSKILDNQKFSPLLEDNQKQLKAIIGVQEYLGSNEFSRAASWANKRELLQLQGGEDLLIAIRQLEASTRQLSKLNKEFEQSQLSKRGLDSQFALAASRFAAALKLNELTQTWQTRAADLVRDKKTRVHPKFYENGVFAGLPVLDPVPDGLQSYKEILAFLPDESARALRRQIGWSKSSVRKEIQSLEADSLELASIIDKTSNQIPELENELFEARNLNQSSKQKIEIAQNLMISELSKPVISKQALSVYSYIRSKGLIKGLPEYKFS